MRRGFIAMLAGLLLLGVASAATGRDVARTIDEYIAFNPALHQYQPLHEEWVPAMGIHWGAPGPHLTLGVGYDDAVVVVEVIYPEAIGRQPWFDQPEGDPTELAGFGMAYTQHLWIAEPGSVQPDQEPTMVALTLAALTAANPALEQYQRLSDEYVPQLGFTIGAARVG